MGLFGFLKKNDNNKGNRKGSNNQEHSDDFTNDMVKSSKSFVERYSDRYNGLDFSIDSLKIVDELLEDASEFYEEMSEDQRQNLIQNAGSYIFEVARKNFGGRYFWYERLKQPVFVSGQPEYEVSILAFSKVKGRLEKGKEDNIPFYFQGYTERIKNKQSGMVV